MVVKHPVENAQSLSAHLQEVKGIVAGIALYGDYGAIDVLYDGEKCERSASLSADIAALENAGYRARCIGRSKAIAIDLTNVGDAIHARFVK